MSTGAHATRAGAVFHAYSNEAEEEEESEGEAEAGAPVTAPYKKGDYRFAREKNSNCDLRLLDFETFGGFGYGVRKILRQAADPAE